MNKKKNARVLVIEDEKALLKIMQIKFLAEGFELLMALDGEDGLRMALAEKPDVILLDLLMPRMDGITMLKKLREDPWGKKAKVVIWSNSRDMAKEQEARKLRCLDFIIKSDFGISEIARRVKELL